MNWRSLDQLSELSELLQESYSSPQVIFKHSTRCGISSMVKSRVEADWEKYNSDYPIYLLDLIQHRDISNQIAEELNVRHESPQLLIIQNGKAIHHASHIGISSQEAATHIQN